MTFDEAKANAEADLRAVAEHFNNAADAVKNGDVDQVAVICEKMPLWQQMLLIRHETRMDEVRTAKPAA